MRIGLVNMMPDKALLVTERQFARLCGLAGPDDLALFGVPGIPRGPDVAAHVGARYRPATEIPAAGLDVLVVSGANVADPRLPAQPFWRPLVAVLAAAERSGLPTLCSCLATHALLEARHGEVRRPVAPKVWGVFDHAAAAPDHPLLAGLPARVPVPHSRHNQLDADHFARAGFRVLLASPQAGPHLAVSADGRRLLMQGHPEYEAVSLLKEYKREVGRWQSGERDDWPPLPEAALAAELQAPWRAPARRVVANWLQAVGAV